MHSLFHLNTVCIEYGMQLAKSVSVGRNGPANIRIISWSYTDATLQFLNRLHRIEENVITIRFFHSL